MHARSSDCNILHNSSLHSCIVSNNLEDNDSQHEGAEGNPQSQSVPCSVTAAPTRATWDVSGHFPKDKGNQRVMTDHPYSGDLSLVHGTLKLCLL